MRRWPPIFTTAILWCSFALWCSITSVLAEPGGPEVRTKPDYLELRFPGAVQLTAVRLSSASWAVVWARLDGDAVRLETLYLTLSSDTPNPAPDPDQPLPEAARLAREWLSLVPDEARAKAPQLAGAFRGVAVRIASGELRDPNSIINASVAANRETLGEHRNAWLPWFQRLRDYMNTLAESGKLTTPEAHGALFRDLASGLEANAR